MPGASKTIEIHTSLSEFFDLIVDFESYPRFLGGLGLTSVAIESRGKDEVVVRQDVKKIGKTISYTLKYRLEKPRLVSWSLVRGDLMSKNEGSWSLEEVEPGKIKATYTIDVRFGLLVPKTIVNMLISTELPSLLEAFKHRAEH